MPAFASGTKTIFQNTSAGTGWTKDTSNYNEHSLRVVNGTASNGGSVNFSSVFTSGTWGGTVSSAGGETIAPTIIDASTMADHTHSKPSWFVMPPAPGPAIAPYNFVPGGGIGFYTAPTPQMVDFSGAGGAPGPGVASAHTHPASSSVPGAITYNWTGSSYNFSIKYVDLILATKN